MAVTAEAWNDRDSWPVSCLIPTIKTGNETELERRATSVLMAVMRAVPGFAHALLKLSELGAPKGAVSTYTEVPLLLADGRRVRPDGIVVVERGKTRWSCLVEVKVNRSPLGTEQVESYLDACREHGFDGVLTISNQIARCRTDSPVSVDKRKLRTVKLSHVSWWRLMTEAVLEHRHRGVADPEQAWILGELISYLDHENSGTCAFEGMGPHWVPVRNSARQGTLRASDEGVSDVALRFEQFTDYVALHLAQDLGCQVDPPRPKGQTRDDRVKALVKELGDRGSMSSSLKIPNTAGNLFIEADLRAKRTTISTRVNAPTEGRPLTRINWLVKQLREAPADLRIDVHFERTKDTTSLLLGQVRENPKAVLSTCDPKRNPRAFTIALGRGMGLKAGRDAKSFVAETRQQLLDFYNAGLQPIQAWQPKAPVLKSADENDHGTETSQENPQVWYMPPTSTSELPEDPSGEESEAA